MPRDDDRDQPPTPRAVPKPRVEHIRPPRRETPITTPSPVLRREQGPMPPRRDVREPLVPTPQTAQAAASQALEAVTTLTARFASLERLIRERESAPSSEVLDLSGTPTPTPAELLEPPPSSGPRSIPARAAEATGKAAKATAKNPVVRAVVLGVTLGLPWFATILDWIRGANVGPIVRGLRFIANALEGLSGQ